MEARHVSVALATLLVLLGVGLGFAPMPVPHRVMHIAVAGFFVLLTHLPFGPTTFACGTRIRGRGRPGSTSSPLPFSSTSLCTCFGIRVTRGAKHDQRLVMKHNKRLVVKHKGKSVDLTTFASKHPGGSVIWKAQGKDVETAWKEQGVAWHAANEKVLKVLEGSPLANDDKVRG